MNQGEQPVIEIWYGLNQTFGELGEPQNWINILGEVEEPNSIASLTYSLNGGPEMPLTIDEGLRINEQGDFNADIAYSELDGSPADDFITFTATDTSGNVSTETVTIDYEGGNVWPQDYSIDWSSTSEISDVAQVVDGLWEIEGDTVRTVEPGYARLISIGDMSWEDYEVTVPITLNGPINPEGGVGVLMRWQGHNEDTSSDDNQPLTGIEPYGALGWALDGNLSINGNGGFSEIGETLEPDTTYNLKMRVETTDIGSLYRLKIWELGQSEPMAWDAQSNEGSQDLDSGSMLLVAHRQDASFGDVDIDPI